MQEKDKENIPNTKRQGWTAEEIAEEAVNQEPDEIVRQMKRGDETKGDADERDVVGGPEKSATPYGRKETKHN